MVAKKTMEASTTPAKDGLPNFARRYQDHSPAPGRNANRDGLFSATMPQSRPKPNQGIHPSRSSMVRASQRITASSRADKVVSQTDRVHQKITLGSSAQAQVDAMATLCEKILRA